MKNCAVGLALFVYSVLSIVSLIGGGLVFAYMHIGRSDSPTLAAVLATTSLFILIPVFASARFSFGYVVACWLYSAVIGFIWISFFSQFDYPHELARWSMAVSLVAATAPLLFLDLPLPRPRISMEAWSRLAFLFLTASLLVLVADAAYGLVFAFPDSDGRNLVARPVLLNYLTGIVIGALIPYLVAYFASAKQWTVTVGTLAIALCYYPVVVNKTVLFLPFWLLFLFWLFGRLEPRLATVLSLLIPLVVGLLDFGSYLLLYPAKSGAYLFSFINLRQIAIPSMALDHYADFFTRHELTHFCQVSVIRKFFGCPYGELGTAMAGVYHDGNFNASFLATEGIASVGLWLAPLSAFACGVVLSMGSAAARHLSPRFVAVSSGFATHALLNVPLTTALLSDGVVVLFLLWWLTPKDLG
jgi:hypothetical protein